MNFVGIDLGTTFSAIARIGPDGLPVTIPNAEGDLITPSVVLFETDVNVVVGREAKRAALAEPQNVAECIKRYMGEPFYPGTFHGHKFSPVAISALILAKLKRDAEKQIGPIAGAVITVPAYFDEARRQATAAAGAVAGLKVLDIINEPTAAALAYIIRNFVEGGGKAEDFAQELAASKVPRVSLVYDLGGGTFDVTLLRSQGVNLKVLATAGDVQLGGRDWDERIAAYFAEAFRDQYGKDPRQDPLSHQALVAAAEDLKKDLSKRTRVRWAVQHAGKTLTGDLTRQEFEKMTADLLFRTQSRLSRVIRDAGLTWESVDEILAVGGSIRMPQVPEMLRQVTGKEPFCGLSPDEAVAHGAAIHAAVSVVKEPAEPLPHEGASQPKRDARDCGDVLAQLYNPKEADEDLAAKKQWMDSMGEKCVNQLKSIEVTDVNAHSLGVVIKDVKGRKGIDHLIPRNTSLPATVTRHFGTSAPDQRRVTVGVVEGESDRLSECIPIGVCRIEPLPPGLPKGSPIEVTFAYDSSSRLHVQAVHVGSGAWADVVIERRKGVDPDMIKFNRELFSRLVIA
ncbi:MAG: Hsp70 family protein [Planctomycetota bacterium]|nr:Hsp70 family protein [Planctomycetota bacterium]